jgi:phage shock protein A
MSLLKRLSITLFSRLDHVVADIENHDALIQAALDEQHKKITAAKIQLGNLTRKKNAVFEQIKQLTLEQQTWQSRASQCALTDTQKARECLKRKQALGQQIAKLDLSYQEYFQAGEKLAANIQRSESELKEVEQKRDLLKARQSSADVMRHMDNNPRANIQQMEKTFERWEANLYESPALTDSELNRDSFAETYLEEEAAQAIDDELAQLIEQCHQENKHE